MIRFGCKFKFSESLACLLWISLQTYYTLDFVYVSVKTLSWIGIHHNISVAVDHKFCEVPRYILDLTRVIIVETTCLFSQVLKNRMCFITIDITFLHDRKLSSHFISCKINDVFRVRVFLVEKLIAGECNYLHSEGLVLIVDVYEFNIALMCERSFRSYIYNDCQLESFH